MPERRKPGVIRDAIINSFGGKRVELSVADICEAVNKALGEEVPPSSVRSYLRLNTPGTFLRTDRGQYRLVRR